MAPSLNTTTESPVIRPITVVTWIEDPAMAAEIRSCLAGLPVQVAIEKESGSDAAGRFLAQLEQVRAEVVLLGLSRLQGPAARLIDQIRATASAPAVIAVDTNTDPQAVLAAIRAGAAEYVYPPVSAHLGAALERVADARVQQTARTQSGKTIAFVSAKGGCGATTVACHVAASLRQQTGKNTLLADFDIETGVVGFLTKTKSTYTVEDAIQNVGRLDSSYWKALVAHAEPGFDVICSPGSASEKCSEDGQGRAEALNFTRSQYDFVVVDLGRGLGKANRNTLAGVDEIYVVTTIDVPALYRCQQIMRGLLDMGCGRDRIHLVVNKISRNAELTKAEIEQMIGLPVGFELPDETSALGEAYVDGKLLPQDNELSRRMCRIARQIAGIAEEAPKSRLSFSWLMKPSESRTPQTAAARA